MPSLNKTQYRGVHKLCLAGKRSQLCNPKGKVCVYREHVESFLTASLQTSKCQYCEVDLGKLCGMSTTHCVPLSLLSVAYKSKTSTTLVNTGKYKALKT